MNKGFVNRDWELLHDAMHKMIPSFTIMGISLDYVNKAKIIQDFATNQEQMTGMEALVKEIASVCYQACQELEVELNRIKKLYDKK
jgi:hypothetical protein